MALVYEHGSDFFNTSHALNSVFSDDERNHRPSLEDEPSNNRKNQSNDRAFLVVKQEPQGAEPHNAWQCIGDRLTPRSGLLATI